MEVDAGSPISLCEEFSAKYVTKRRAKKQKQEHLTTKQLKHFNTSSCTATVCMVCMKIHFVCTVYVLYTFVKLHASMILIKTGI